MSERILKQLEQIREELKELQKEREKYVKILKNRKERELSDNTEELSNIPIYLSHYIHKRIHSLSNEDKDSSRELEKKIQQAIDYLCNSCR